MRETIFIGAVLCAAFITPQTTQAQIAELRVGLTEFDERSLNLEGGESFRADENSLGINAEIIFEEPKFLKWALSPQPYINGTLNVEGNTSFGGAGLMWRQTLGKRFYADFAFGGVIHDGATEHSLSDADIAILDEAAMNFNNDPMNFVIPSDALQILQESSALKASSIQFGSRLLFREQVTVGVNFNEDWAGEVFFEHLSNAGLSENGRNPGVNNLGIKVARKF